MDFHQAVQLANQPANARVADAEESRLGVGDTPGAVPIATLHPADIISHARRAQHEAGRARQQARHIGRAAGHWHPVDIIAEAQAAQGGHHRGATGTGSTRTRTRTPAGWQLIDRGITERVHPLLAGSRALVPVFNPHDADRGISSQHHIPSAGPVSATTSGTVAVAPSPPEANSFWHPVGTIVSAALDYYMGNDPCRTTDRTVSRRRLGAGEDCVGTDETLEETPTAGPQTSDADGVGFIPWKEGARNLFIRASGDPTADLPPPKQVTMAAPSDRQLNKFHTQVVSKLQASFSGAHRGPEGTLTACALKRDMPRVDDQANVMSQGATIKTEEKHPAERDAIDCGPELVPFEVVPTKQEWTVYMIGGIMLLALLALALT